MYLWNIKSLRQELRTGDSSDAATWPYFFAYSILQSGAAVAYLSERGRAPEDPERLAAWLSIAVTAVGLYYAYRRNGGKTGRLFLNRYFALSWVVSIRVLLVFIPLFILIGLAFSPKDIEILTHWLDLVWIPAEIYIYFRVGQEIAGIAANDQPLGAKT